MAESKLHLGIFRAIATSPCRALRAGFHLKQRRTVQKPKWTAVLSAAMSACGASFRQESFLVLLPPGHPTPQGSGRKAATRNARAWHGKRADAS